MSNVKLLEVDLSSGSTRIKEINEDLQMKHLGGSGLAAKLLYDERTYEADPLGPDNTLIFMNGLFTGIPVSCGCKLSVCAKSPLTGIWGEATMGGFFGAEFAKTGFGGVIVRGVAEMPVYLLVEDDSVEIKDAGDLWGLDVYETCSQLQKKHGERHEVLCIGPAGERKVLIAGVMAGGNQTRAAGRTGLGAVMGSKHLKAIIVKGTSQIPIKDRERLSAYIREFTPIIRTNAKALTDFGTAGGVMGVEANGDLSIRNWSLGSWEEGAAKTSGQRIAETVFVSHYGCFACPIRCGKDVRVEVGPYAGSIGHGPEYETCDGFGANLLNDDLNVICAANDLCNRLGLDTISTSGVIGWAMECYEHGLISKEDTGGLEIHWGDGEVILKLVEMIGHNEGFGALLAQGVKRASESIGGLAKEFAVETKGLEYAYHDPRAFTSMAVNYATANRGACHLEALGYFAEQGVFTLSALGFDKPFERYGAENKAEIAYLMQNFMEVFNDLGLCKFLIRAKEAIGPDVIADWIAATKGWEISGDDIMRAGERNFNLKRMYNFALGITRKDDTLPPRLGVHDKKTGAAAGSIPYMGRMLVDYYALRGWTQEGVPREDKLRELQLL